MTDRLPDLYSDHISTLKQRADRALAEAKFDHLVVHAGSQRLQFLDDMYYPFKVNPQFKAWVPVVDNPHCWIVYTPGQKPRLIYWQPVDYWHKPADTPSGFWVEHFDIRMIADPGDAKQHFPTAGHVAFIGEGEANPEEVLNALHYERAWKTDYELECLRRANERGARGHRATERAFLNGSSEYELHVDYLRATDHTEEELPYGNIIALNEHASVLHYYHHERRRLDPARRHSFLIDAGASFNGYASDITRTHSANDHDEFHDLIAAMDEAQQALCDEVRPGVNYPDLHMLAHRRIADILARFDFISLDADAIVEKRISSAFFPHGVGHYLGLQVHDVGGFMADRSGKAIEKPEGHPYLRLTRKLEPRNVFTIEPGLYFIEPLLTELAAGENSKHVNWPKVDSFRKFGGIRIEDNIAVTERGFENMTRNAFAAVS